MSWSLQLRNGDLVIDGAKLGAVSAQQKLTQDLRCAILERMGHDDLHPNFGSLIDGGRLNGVEHPSIIATDDWNRAVAIIDAEIRRVVSVHQAQQMRRTEDDRLIYGKPTLQPGEVLLGIAGIQFFQAQDNLLVRVTLTTGNEDQIQINVPLG